MWVAGAMGGAPSAFVNIGTDYMEPGLIHFGGHGAMLFATVLTN